MEGFLFLSVVLSILIDVLTHPPLQNALEEARLKKGGALTEAEIRDVVAQVNEEVRQERLCELEAIVCVF